MGFDVALSPFDVRFVAGLGSEQKPFRWIVSPLAGTGVVQVAIGSKGLDVLVQGGLGLGLAIDLGIASGSASVALAVQLNTGPDPFEIKGILSGRASVDVLQGLASATITLAAGLGIIPPPELFKPPFLPPSLAARRDSVAHDQARRVGFGRHPSQRVLGRRCRLGRLLAIPAGHQDAGDRRFRCERTIMAARRCPAFDPRVSATLDRRGARGARAASADRRSDASRRRRRSGLPDVRRHLVGAARDGAAGARRASRPRSGRDTGRDAVHRSRRPRRPTRSRCSTRSARSSRSPPPDARRRSRQATARQHRSSASNCRRATRARSPSSGRGPARRSATSSAARCATPTPATDSDPKPPATVTWGAVLSFALRQPLLARALGLLHDVTIPLVPRPCSNAGGWLYVELDPAGPRRAAHARRRAPLRRAPAGARAGDARRARCSGRAVPGRPDGAGDYGDALTEAAIYDDGFAKIVHAAQAVTADAASSSHNMLPPATDAGIDLGWDDEQVTRLAQPPARGVARAS